MVVFGGHICEKKIYAVNCCCKSQPLGAESDEC